MFMGGGLCETLMRPEVLLLGFDVFLGAGWLLDQSLSPMWTPRI